MRARASVPVTAPGPRQWQAWWSGVVSAVVRGAADGAGPAGGEAWRPGTRWDLTPAGLTRGSAEATVRAAGSGRAVSLTYREHADPSREVEVDVDGLEQPRGATTSGTLDPVGWTGKASMAATGPDVRLDVALPWGRLRLRARVAGDRLDSELMVRGRGLWRPLAAVGLRLVRGRVRAELTRATERVATAVSEVAREPGAALARPDDGFGDPTVGETLDAALDLSWLRSPVTMLRHMLRGSATVPEQRR